MLSIGIIGLPNVGKSTLFNALTKNKVDAKNFPFCTIDPNVGVVPVPDHRLGKLAEAVNARKIVPTVVEFIDIAGIVKGANKGEGLGNKFLANIRECDAIIEVVRDFTDENVVHVGGKIDAASDMETIKTELILKDLESIESQISKLEKETKKNPKQKPTLEMAIKVRENLEKGVVLRDANLVDEKNKEAEKKITILKSFQLLTTKPHLYVLNVDEEHIINNSKQLTINNSVKISAKIEAELSDLTDEERNEYLKEIGQDEPGLNKLVKRCYNLLGLQTFFTAGEKEAKAWTIKKGWTAPKAAGVIHTDFEKGFIKADVINWQDLVDAPDWAKAREQGKVRLEGKDYIVKDGDVMVFKFSN